MSFSDTAKAEGIPNQPDAAAVEALRPLCTAVLGPLRDAVGQPIKVNSGYRGPALNKRLRGATTGAGEILLTHFGPGGSVTCPRITAQQALRSGTPAPSLP